MRAVRAVQPASLIWLFWPIRKLISDRQHEQTRGSRVIDRLAADLRRDSTNSVAGAGPICY